MESFIVEHWKFVAALVVLAGLGGLLVSITGRAAMRKWLLNGTDENIKSIKAMLEQRIAQVDEHAQNACPIAAKGHTPLTKEEHAEICGLTQKVVVESLKPLQEAQRVVKDDIKKILAKVGG